MDKSEKSDTSLVRFNGKNYASWAFQFQLYLEGKQLWGHIDGSETLPVDDAKKILSWKTKDVKIKSWILSSVEPDFILYLRPCKTSKDTWEYLKKDYYLGFLILWSEYDEIKFVTVSEALLPELISLQQNNHLDQLLMNLHPEYETVRSNLMSRASLPNVDDCLQELLRTRSRGQ